MGAAAGKSSAPPGPPPDPPPKDSAPAAVAPLLSQRNRDAYLDSFRTAKRDGPSKIPMRKPHAPPGSASSSGPPKRPPIVNRSANPDGSVNYGPAVSERPGAPGNLLSNLEEAEKRDAPAAVTPATIEEEEEEESESEEAAPAPAPAAAAAAGSASSAAASAPMDVSDPASASAGEVSEVPGVRIQVGHTADSSSKTRTQPQFHTPLAIFVLHAPLLPSPPLPTVSPCPPARLLP